MIVKMTILRLLGSSDGKEKIGLARPEGPHLSVQRTRIENPQRNQVKEIKTEIL